MSLTPAKMKFVNLVILDRDVRRVTTVLGNLGVLELVKVKPEGASGRVTLPDRSGEVAQCRALLASLDGIRDRIGLTEVPASKEDSYAPLAAIAQEIAALESRVDPLLEQRAKIGTESEEIQDELARFDALAAVAVPLPRLFESPFLHFAVGTIKATDLARLTEKARRNIILMSRPIEGDRHNLLAITSRKGRFALETQLRQHNFVKEDLARFAAGTPATIVEGLYKRVNAIRAEQERISQELKDIAQTQGQKIADMDRRLRLELSLAEASMNFGRTSATCLIAGWLPEAQVAAVSSRLLRETEGRLFLQVQEPGESGVPAGEVPVLLKNHAWIRRLNC